MRVYLVRHGKDDDAVRGGWSDQGLAELGREQVVQLAEKLRAGSIRVGRIYSSDLRRAKETAGILSEALGCPVEYLAAFRETNNGDLAGMKNELAERKYPGLYWSSLAYDEPYPNGESPKAFFERIQMAWDAFKNDRLKQDNADVMLVTHAGVIEAILCIENGLEFSNQEKYFRIPHAALIPVEIEME